jgi:hypothetical protein
MIPVSWSRYPRKTDRQFVGPELQEASLDPKCLAMVLAGQRNGTRGP